MALHQEQERVLLRDIARRQQIPLPYLRNLIAPLMIGGILRSTRGIWIELQKTMEGVLEATTLRDLMERQWEKEQTVAAMYHI